MSGGYFSTPGVNLHPNLAHSLGVLESITNHWNIGLITLNEAAAQQRRNAIVRSHAIHCG